METTRAPERTVTIRPRRVVGALAAGVAGVLLGVLLGWLLVSVVVPEYGIATELRVDGEHSGVYQLAVTRGGRVLPLASDEPRIAVGRADVEPSGDQVRARDVGWQSACVAWGEIGVLGADQVASCALTHDPPPVWYSEAGRGPSAKLSHALAYADSMFDLTGHLKVAATGDLEIVDAPREGSPIAQDVLVEPIGGVPQKAQAAVAAGVDVLVVPELNYDEFVAQPVIRRSRLRVIPAATLDAAVTEIGLLSGSEAVTSRRR